MDREHARRILGIGSDASPAEVDAAFRRLAAGAHPDRGGDAGRFEEIVAARRLLAGRADAAEPRSPVQVVADPGPLDRLARRAGLTRLLRWRRTSRPGRVL